MDMMPFFGIKICRVPVTAVYLYNSQNPLPLDEPDLLFKLPCAKSKRANLYGFMFTSANLSIISKKEFFASNKSKFFCDNAVSLESLHSFTTMKLCSNLNLTARTKGSHIYT